MSVSWLKKGADSAKLQQQEEAAAEARKAEMGKMRRFFLKDKEEARITFVDGELSAEGFLLPPRFYEHFVEHAGRSDNFVCPEKTNPESGEKCPICEMGDRPSLVALFTIIDHRQFKGKDGTIYQDTPKLLAAKPLTFEILNKIAIKRGGLAGVTFDVSRVGDKAAAVGSMFDFVEKHTDIEALQQAFQREVRDPKTGKVLGTETSFKPADYETEIVFRSEADLRKLGFGKSSVGGFKSTASGIKVPGHAMSQPPQQTAKSYEEHL